MIGRLRRRKGLFRMLKTVSVRKLQQHFQLEIVCGEEQLDRNITVSDLYRPGLELSGFFTYHPIERLQILGKTELTFIESLSPDVRKQRIERFCHPFLPCICVTRNMEIPEELIHIAKRHRVPLLRTVLATTRFSSKVTNYLEKVLAPTTTVHGVLVDIYGEGVLIMGDSGIGKSETALELVKRGHRLVADDAVEIKQAEENMLIGSAPELIRHLLEIRGLGIINVMTLFGAGAVRNKKRLSFVIQLETWQANRQYDRLGLDEERMKIIDTNVPLLTVPVRPGRNLAVIIEVAAMNMRLRQMGYDAAQQFVQKLGETIDDQDPDVDDYD